MVLKWTKEIASFPASSSNAAGSTQGQPASARQWHINPFFITKPLSVSTPLHMLHLGGLCLFLTKVTKWIIFSLQGLLERSLKADGIVKHTFAAPNALQITVKKLTAGWNAEKIALIN